MTSGVGRRNDRMLFSPPGPPQFNRRHYRFTQSWEPEAESEGAAESRASEERHVKARQPVCPGLPLRAPLPRLPRPGGVDGACPRRYKPPLSETIEMVRHRPRG